MNYLLMTLLGISVFMMAERILIFQVKMEEDVKNHYLGLENRHFCGSLSAASANIMQALSFLEEQGLSAESQVDLALAYEKWLEAWQEKGSGDCDEESDGIILYHEFHPSLDSIYPNERYRFEP